MRSSREFSKQKLIKALDCNDRWNAKRRKKYLMLIRSSRQTRSKFTLFIAYIIIAAAGAAVLASSSTQSAPVIANYAVAAVTNTHAANIESIQATSLFADRIAIMAAPAFCVLIGYLALTASRISSALGRRAD